MVPMIRISRSIALVLLLASSTGRTGSSGEGENTKYADAVYAVFQKQTADFVANVRPEKDPERKLQAWAKSAQLLSRELSRISAQFVTDKKLVELKQRVEEESSAQAGMLLAPGAQSNTAAILKQSLVLDKAQEAFDQYVESKGY